MFTNDNLTLINKISKHRGLVFGLMILMALFAFELFNFSTTEFALRDLISGYRFLGISWATILALAFCGIDFAGIARIFTPEIESEEQGETWFLFGAWILAASMNALLTWWGVSLAILEHSTLGNGIVDRGVLLQIIPIFVAVMVWLIRVLIVGTYSLSGERLFTQANPRTRPIKSYSSLSASPEFEEVNYPLPITNVVHTPLSFSPHPKTGVKQRELTPHPVRMPRGREG